MRSHFATAIFALFAVPAAHAGLIDVQFGSVGNSIGLQPTPNYTGAGVLGAAGDQWNEFVGPLSGASPATNLPLTDATGAATNVTLSYTGVGGFYNSVNSSIHPLMGGTSYANLLDSYMFTTGTATLTLSGLTAGAAYDLVLYGIANSAGRVSRFTVDGTTHSVVAVATPGLTEGSTYTEFANVIADINGHIIVAATGGAGEADINGFQIADAVASPEPGTAALLLTGATFVGWHRFRRGSNA